MTLAHRELVRFFRQRNRVFGALGQPIIFWLLFSEGLRGNQLDYAHFFPGTYLEDTGPSNGADFGYVMATITF